MGVQEKRQSKRMSQYLKVQFYFGSNTEPIQVFTEDISTGGIRIQSPFPIDERYQFPMHIFLNQDPLSSIKVIARVAWQRKNEDSPNWEMGIEFVQMQDADRDLVGKFVKSA